MCLAPRYIRGPIAAPWILCRNTASLPDTPCASMMPGIARISRHVAATTVTNELRIFIMSPISQCLLPLVFLVTVVAGNIQRIAVIEHEILILCRNRLQHVLAGGHHRA